MSTAGKSPVSRECPLEKLLAAADAELRFPVLKLRSELGPELEKKGTVVLSAPPGSGKTTLLPLLLFSEKWLEGKKIIMLEPRRLAARAAARRMAGLLGEEVGRRVGYRVRHETRIGPETRIEVVTEGILTRILQHDPELSGYGLVIFDEFHERHLQGDLGLVFSLEARELFRPDLKILLMSATLDLVALAGLPGPVARLSAAGRIHPVETLYSERDEPEFSLDLVGRTVLKALDETGGDLLVFLPGAGEIRRLEKRLGERFSRLDAAGEIELLPLYGDLPPALQDRVFRPGGKRRVILATDIAESSITVPGVRVVVDSGWRRMMLFDPASGMGRLRTVRISRAAADQRRGRAGREAAGVCYRLWSRARQQELAAFHPPEMLSADLCGLALELAVWGTDDATGLWWPTPPPAAGLRAARELLVELEALDDDFRVTASGTKMAGLGLHPRLARMILKAWRAGVGREVVALAVLLENRDLFAGGGATVGADLETRLEILKTGESGPGGNEKLAAVRFGIDRARLKNLRRAVDNLARRAGIGQDKGESEEVSRPIPGELLAWAFPDRIAQKREGGGRRYRLSGGGEAFFAEPEPLAGLEYLVVAELTASRTAAGFASGRSPAGGRIRLAAAYSEDSLRKQFAERIWQQSEVCWEVAESRVRAVARETFGALVLAERRLDRPPAEELAAAWLEGIRRQGLDLLKFFPALRQWCGRVEFLRRLGLEETAGWPPFDPETLLAAASSWLGPALGRVRRREELEKLDLSGLLKNRLGWGELEKLERLAPESLELPGGRRRQLDYLAGERPVLKARVQELFGWQKTPRVAGGRVPVLLHILSPARRPVQVTDDLEGFWRGSYAAVRKEMRGRYPKHAWPEDPLAFDRGR